MFLGFGIGFDDNTYCENGEDGRSERVYDTYPIPFGTSLRVTAQMPDSTDEKPALFWIIRGSEIPVQIAGGNPA